MSFRKDKATISNITVFICFLCAFALGIKSLREPDLWWQLGTGEWILSHFSIPKTDIFSYTFSGTPWINIKWGFEVLAALITRISDASDILILQAVVNILLVFFLLKTSREFRKRIFPGKKEQDVFKVSLVICLLIFLIGSEYRMTGRPEMFSHLFTILFLYLYIKNSNSLNGKIFLIIPLQMIWANMHEAYGIGIIISIVFCIAAWFEFIFNTESDSKKRAMWFTITLALSFFAILINPNGSDLLFRPFNILRQVQENKYTTELFSYTATAFWKKEAWLALAILLIITFFVFKIFRSKKKNIHTAINRINPGYILLLIAFVYLGANAYRNIALFLIVSFPLWVLGMEWLASALPGNERSIKIQRYFLLASSVLLYVLIVSNKYYEITRSRDRFGLEVMSINNPVGAAGYIRAHNLGKEKCFSDYLSSSYLLYTLRPDFKTYIDLRDLDIFPTGFFDDYIQLTNNPKYFLQIDQQMKFRYAVLYRMESVPLHTYLYNDSLYALVYLDGNSAVYEKTDSFSRDDIYTKTVNPDPGLFSKIINHIMNPFYQSFDVSTLDNDELAGSYYLEVLRFDLAQRRAENLYLTKEKKYKGLNLSGEIMYQKAIHEKDEQKRKDLFLQSKNYFFDALQNNKNSPDAHFGLALVYMQESNTEASLKEIDKSLEINKDQYQAHVAAAFINKKLFLNSGNEIQRAEQMAYHFTMASGLNPGNPEIEFNAGLAYYYLHDCKKSSDWFKESLKNKFLSPDSRQVAEKYLKECNE